MRTLRPEDEEWGRLLDNGFFERGVRCVVCDGPPDLPYEGCEDGFHDKENHGICYCPKCVYPPDPHETCPNDPW